MLNSDWCFGGSRGEIPLVKRFIGYHGIGSGVYDEQLGTAAGYILETCELEISREGSTSVFIVFFGKRFGL